MSIRWFAVALITVSLLFGYTAVLADDAVNKSKKTQQLDADELRQILTQILTKLDSVDLRLRQLEEQLKRHGAAPKKSETHQRISKQQIEDLLRRDPLYSHAAHALGTKSSKSDTAEIWLLKKQLDQRRRELTPLIIHQLKRGDANTDTQHHDSDD